MSFVSSDALRENQRLLLLNSPRASHLYANMSNTSPIHLEYILQQGANDQAPFADNPAIRSRALELVNKMVTRIQTRPAFYTWALFNSKVRGLTFATCLMTPVDMADLYKEVGGQAGQHQEFLTKLFYQLVSDIQYFIREGTDFAEEDKDDLAIIWNNGYIYFGLRDTAFPRNYSFSDGRVMFPI